MRLHLYVGLALNKALPWVFPLPAMARMVGGEESYAKV
jgi:hypothetical protein